MLADTFLLKLLLVRGIDCVNLQIDTCQNSKNLMYLMLDLKPKFSTIARPLAPPFLYLSKSVSALFELSNYRMSISCFRAVL